MREKIGAHHVNRESLKGLYVDRVHETGIGQRFLCRIFELAQKRLLGDA